MSAPERLGPFQVVRALGQGGMGAVYEVIDPQLGRAVALKLLSRSGRTEVAAERFHREGEILARLQHENVVKIHRVGALPEGPYLLEERVEGRPLDEVLASGPLPAEAAASLVRALADALVAVHAAGIVHRDLKPANVILRDDASPVLIDFGVARDLDAETLTKTGAMVGTVAYMSPEQVRHRGAAPVDGRADVYALGLLLYELLTGAPRYQGAPLRVVAEILLSEPPSCGPEVPPDLEALILACLRKAPGERPDATSLRDELDRFLRGESTESAERLSRERRSRARRALGLVGAALALVAGALAFALGPGGSASPQASTAAPRDALAERAAAALSAGDAALAESILQSGAEGVEGTAPAGFDRSALELRVALARAEELVSRLELAPAAERLRRARRLDPQAAQAGLERATAALLRAHPTDPAHVPHLEALAAVWPGATLPDVAAGPFLAEAGRRLTQGGDADVLAAAELTASARRWAPAAAIPAGLGFAGAQVGAQAMARGDHDLAARLLVAGTRAGTVDPGQTAARDLRTLAQAEAFERILADDPSAPVARLWGALAAADRVRAASPSPGRARRGREVLSELRAVRALLPPRLGAAAAGSELRVQAALDPTQAAPLADELWTALGGEGWRLARVAAQVLRRDPQRAVSWARRALDGAARDAPGSEVHRDALETLVRRLVDAGRSAQASGELERPGARELLGPELTAGLRAVVDSARKE